MPVHIDIKQSDIGYNEKANSNGKLKSNLKPDEEESDPSTGKFGDYASPTNDNNLPNAYEEYQPP